ncbi:MAG: phosphatase PAP2 family protein [Methanobacterium sp.]|nr:phosphatase PAP2 family protein [Methanobacterium sp.]
MWDFISLILNQNIILFYVINHGLDNNFFDFIMPLITNFGSILAWIVVCAVLFIFGGENGKKVAILGLAALFLSNVLVYLLKLIVAEPRPFLTLPHVDLLVSENDIYSFPSSHTASSFALAIIIGLKYKLNFKGINLRLIYPLLAFAGIVGFSRIYVGVHYPFDILFGALVGILSAILVLKVGNNVLVDKIVHVCVLDELERF